jgi:glycolate oxidase FAD binding subunit
MAELKSAKSAQALRAIVVEGVLRQGCLTDAVCCVVPELYAEPAGEAELAQALKFAAEAGMQVAPRGGSTKLSWGTAPQAVDLVVSTAKLNQIIEHAPGDMTITVEAGATIEQVQRALAPHGQRLALDPLWPGNSTVGGVIATNDSGALRLRYGGVRDLIIGITVALPDGTIAKSGGKVVKNVAGYDLPKLMCGALGTLGIITRAVFRLHPLPETSQSLSFSFTNRESANQFMLSITDSIVVPTGLQMRTEASGVVEADVRLEGIAAGVVAQAEIVRRLAGEAKPLEPAGDPWQARERLFETAGSPTICKLSMLPNQLASTAEFVREALSVDAEWSFVTQSTGLCWLRVDAGTQVPGFISSLRSFMAPADGTVVLLEAPGVMRQELDVWGEAGSALPLMKRIKEQFDPHGILNRGRFVGGI